MPWIDVDTAIELFVNADPLVASADGFTIDETIAYNESGMDLNWNFITTAGVVSQTNVTPTTGGDYDWAHVGNGMYKIEMTASGGASANNDTEGFGWWSGKADAILPFISPMYGFRKASMNNVMVDNGTLQDNLEDMYDGTGYAMGTIKPQTDLTQILAHTLTDTGTQLADGFQTFFDVAGPTTMLAINLPNQTMDITGTITGDLAGDVTGNVDGTVAGKTPAEVGDLGTVQSADNDTKLTSILSLLDDARGEPGDVAPPVNPDLATKIDYLYKFLRNKIETTATRIHVYDDAGTNKDQSSVISDDGTTFTRGEFGAGD